MSSLGRLLIGLAFAAGTAGTALARDFTVTGWGGAIQDARRDVYFTPFGKAEGIVIRDDVYAGGWAPFKAMQDTGVVQWDVVQVETAEMVRGCQEGIFAEIDWTKIGPKSEFVPAAVSKCGVGTIIWAVVVAYNADTIKGSAPATAKDFWDVNRWPGKRAMRQGPTVNIEFAMMADEVPPQDVYKELRKPGGIDRAFRKLNQIKPHVVWWKAGAQAPEWLITGNAVMALAYNGRVTKAVEEGKNLKMIWDNALYDADAYVIPAKSPNVDLAYKFIKFASDPARQAKVSEMFAYGPTARAASGFIRPERNAVLPAGDNVKTGLHIGSDEAREFWGDNLEDITARWNTWVSSQ
jgi:putative spermidine/putrescine transport system substrate-binding protein